MLKIETYVEIGNSLYSKKIFSGQAINDNYIVLRPLSFDVNESWDNFYQTASIKFNLSDFKINDDLTVSVGDYKISKGDSIRLNCKYVGKGEEYNFWGFIKDFDIDFLKDRFSIECVDFMYIFDNGVGNIQSLVNFNKSFTNLTLEQIIEELIEQVSLGGLPYAKISGKYGTKRNASFSFKPKVWNLNDSITFNINKNISAGEVLRLLKKRYEGMKIFIRPESIFNSGIFVLYAGWPYWFEEENYSTTHKFMYPYDYDKNEEYNPVLSIDGKFNPVDKNKTLVVVTCANKETKSKVEGRYPLNLNESDADDIRSINFNDGLYTESELQNCAKSIHNDIDVGSFSTTLEVQGCYNIWHGDKILLRYKMINKIIEDKMVVKSVETYLNDKGFRQKLQLIGLERNYK